MKNQKLNMDDINAQLADISGWAVGENGASIAKTFKFSNFVEAFGFMTASALVAERLNHHPDWHNIYSTVSVTLTTHDAGGLTELDFKLAKAMEIHASSRLK